MKKILSITVMLLIVSMAFFACDSREFSTTPTTVEGFEPPVVSEPVVPVGPVLKKNTPLSRTFTTTAKDTATNNADGNNIFFQTAEEKHTLGELKFTFTKFKIKVDGTEVDIVDKLGEGGTFVLDIPVNPYGKDNTANGNATMGFQGKFSALEKGLPSVVNGKEIVVDLVFTANRDVMDDIEWGIADTNAEKAYWNQLTTSIKITDDDDPAFN